LSRDRKTATEGTEVTRSGRLFQLQRWLSTTSSRVDVVTKSHKLKHSSNDTRACPPNTSAALQLLTMLDLQGLTEDRENANPFVKLHKLFTHGRSDD